VLSRPPLPPGAVRSFYFPGARRAWGWETKLRRTAMLREAKRQAPVVRAVAGWRLE